MVTISIGKADTECPDKVTLTSGMVKAVQVAFTFSEGWEGFDKIAVFSNGKTSLDVSLDDEDKCYIPHEILAVPGKEVTVGVYGSKGEGDDYTAIPTEKCSLGKVVEGVNPSGEEPAEPTPTVWEDLNIRVKNLEEAVPTKLSQLEADSISGYELSIGASRLDISGGSIHICKADYGFSVDGNRIQYVGDPEEADDAANKGYVDGLVGDIDTALDSIISIQNSLIGGDA